MKRPFVTIITATYNAKYDLLITAESIRNQDYENIEWIIVDGKSTDGTQGSMVTYTDLIYQYIY